MATTKRMISEQILRILNSGDVTMDNSLDLREIMMAIEQERDRLVRMRLFESMQLGQAEIPGDVISHYDNVGIFLDSNKGMLYSNLPNEPLSLPNDYGVWQISYQKDQYDTFVRMPNGSLGLYNGLLSSSLGGRKGFFVEGNRVYYNANVDDCCGNKILLKMVINSGNIDEDANLPIPADLISEVIKNVVQLYAMVKQMPNDEQNDNIE